MFENIYVLLVLGLLGLVLGGEFFVRGASRLALSLGIPSMIIGLTVVALGTSMPEMAVSLKAVLDGNSNIALANVVGSNTFNILFILGVSALVAPLVIHSKMIRREIPIMIFVSLLLYAFAWDKSLARWEGVVFLVLGLLYTAWLIRESLQFNRELAPAKNTKSNLVSSLVWLFFVGPFLDQDLNFQE